MTITNLSIVSTTTYGVPSGNYDGSSLDFNSDGVKAAGYYQGQGSVQTVLIRVTGFVGIIKLQATLDENWESAKWFDLEEFGDGSTADTDTRSYSLIGNFAWMRAAITSFESGTINYITISY